MIIIVYDSAFGNTAQVAKTIVDSAKQKDIDAACYKVSDVSIDLVSQADFILFGSPTQSFKATKSILDFIDTLNASMLKNKKVAVFDTRIDINTIKNGFLKWMVKIGGYADSTMKKKLHRKGVKNIFSEGFIVLDREGPLKEGELSRAAQWINTLTSL